jgi:hypothetical protein
MSRETDILDRIKADLQGITGSGFTYDLSGDDRVVIGQTFQSHRVPGAYIFPGAVRSTQTAATVLSRYDRQFLVQIEGWVPAINDTPGTAVAAALNLGSDIMKALESDRSLNGLVHDVQLDLLSFDGAELQRPNMGAVVVQLTITYSETAGA